MEDRAFLEVLSRVLLITDAIICIGTIIYVIIILYKFNVCLPWYCIVMI